MALIRVSKESYKEPTVYTLGSCNENTTNGLTLPTGVSYSDIGGKRIVFDSSYCTQVVCNGSVNIDPVTLEAGTSSTQHVFNAVLPDTLTSIKFTGITSSAATHVPVIIMD